MGNQHQNAKEIFLQLIGTVPPEERELRLVEATEGDDDLRRRVRELLLAHTEPGSLLEEPLEREESDTTLALPVKNRPSTQIGRYKLLQQIGEGGMGVVYMAEQKEPVSRRVALKIIKPGMDSRQVIARFEAERQALAMMDHPNIAKVLDAGTTDQGSPYFVMELVQGIPLTRYCDQNKLSISERLELFIPVCQAVQHAHQKGIIHRDLKPSNVLVCLYDGRPVAKVIDFGLAKALQQQTKLTDKTMFTEFGQVVGTLQYMSPEQAEMNQLDVDTRTDIYSLGVMLYELLTGSTPVDQETLKQQAILQVLAAIREKEPPRPSVRLGSSANDVVEGISQQRQIDPIKLQSILRGELDWIVMKALEKDRTRRYDTASNFAKDIENYLTGNVVAARPPSTAYRFSKYVRKHKGLVGSVATIAMLLVTGIIGTSIGLYRANEARKETDEARVVAERERGIADDARLDAIEKAKELEIEKRNVEIEKASAELKREQAEASSARSNYFLALARFRENRVLEAYEALDLVPAKYRHVEWYLARRLFQEGYLTFYGHEGGVQSVAFSKDGAKIYSWSSDATLRHWNSASGKEICSRELLPFREYGGMDVLAISESKMRLSTDMNWAFLLRDNRIAIFDTIEEKVVHTLPHRSDTGYRVIGAAFSTDGSKIAFALDECKVQIWDTILGEIQKSFECEVNTKPSLTNVVFSPDGSNVALVRGSITGTVEVIDIQSSEKLYSIDVSDFWGGTLKFSPDGTRMVTASRSGSLIDLWSASSGEALLTLSGHSAGVSCVAFSPDGKILASGSCDGTIKLWDIKTGRELRIFRGHLDAVNSVSFSPDGTRLVSGSEDRTLKLFDLTVNAPPETLFLDTAKPITAVAASPNGAAIACGDIGGNIMISNSSNLKDAVWVNAHDERVTAVSFSPEGKRIASSSNDSLIKVWDLTTRAEMLELQGHTNGVSCISWSPDGSHIVSGGQDKFLKLWNAESGRQQFSVVAHPNSVNSVAFSPEGSLIVSGGEDDSVRLWNARTGRSLMALQGHAGSILGTIFSPDGSRVVSTSFDATIRIWDSQTGKSLVTVPMNDGVSIRGVFHSDGTRVFAAPHNTTKIWDTVTGEELLTVPEMDSHEIDVSFQGSRGRIFSASFGKKRISVMNADSTAENRTLQGHATQVTGFSFNKDSTLILAVSKDGSVRVWNSANQSPVTSISGIAGKGIRHAAFYEDGERIVSSSTPYLDYWQLWDGSTGEELCTVDDSRDVLSVAFSPDRKQFIEGTEMGEIRLFDGTNGRLVREFQAHRYSVLSIAFHPNASQFVSASHYGDMKLWDSATGRELLTLSGHTDTINCLAFSPNGKLIASASDDNSVKIWDASTGQPLQSCLGHNARVSLVSFSHDGKWIISVGSDDTLRIWDIATGLELRAINFSKGSVVQCITFSSSCDRIAVVTEYDTLHLLDVATGRELRMLEDPGLVNCVAVSPDGKRMYLPHEFGGDLFLETQAVKRLLSDDWKSTTASKTKSDDGRWLLSSVGKTVLLVDLNYQNQLFQQAIRSSKSKPNPRWHREQVADAPNGYSKLFHLAWVMKHEPSDPNSYDQLHEAYAQWVAEWNAHQEQTNVLLTSESENQKRSETDPNQLLPPIVREMLALPRGSKGLEPTSESEADNHELLDIDELQRF